VALALFAAGGLCIACFWPTILSVASDHIAPGSTSLFALLASAGVIGSMAVPWAIGVLGDAFGLRGAVALLPACMIGVLVLLVFAAREVAARLHHKPVVTT
jgi:fucose permease